MRLLLLSCAACCAPSLAPAQNPPPPGNWATVKGQVVFPEDKPIPKRAPLDVKTDKPHCLSKGDILDESILVNPKTRGIRNVVVYLRPLDPKTAEFDKEQIHPDDAKRKPAEVAIDQPCCMFVRRVTVARPGDTLVVKNPSPVAHNFFWSSGKNGDVNVTIPAGKDWTMENKLAAEGPAIQYKCTIHGWMTGYVRVFDHPYHAVTDADGKFEIKNAPVGKFRIVYWHETGVRGGAPGRFGDVVNIAGPVFAMQPTAFEVGASEEKK